jgi:hypothetical protein
MPANWKPKSVVGVFKRESENVSVMGDLYLLPEAQLDITLLILHHLLQNATFLWN